jgi:thiamine biosynthesis protein ThiI
MYTNAVMLRYGELFLKSEPVKKRYLGFLKQHINAVLRAHEVSFELAEYRGRILIHVAPEKTTVTCTALSKVFGILSLSPAWSVSTDFEDIAAAAVMCAQKKVKAGMSFAVRARRDNVSGYTSQSLAADVGAAIYTAVPGLSVDLTNPDYEIFVEAKPEGALVYDERVPGPRGLPLGTQGRVISLLSAGIDSPVATWLMMKRGVLPSLLHVDTGTYGGGAIANCTIRNACSLSLWSGAFPLTLITISAQSFFDYITSRPDLYRYRCILCKRFMLACAQEIAIEGAAGIVTGDNLGQVASQTIDNLYTLTTGVRYPIFRPLLTYDKDEIVALARKIGTFIDAPGDTSCTAVPKKPSIAAPKETIDAFALEMDLDLFVTEALKQRNVVKVVDGRVFTEVN